MSADQTARRTPFTAESVEASLLEFLGERVSTEITPDQDLFRSGLVSSMFAMQLVVHLEEAYDVAIVGAELNLDNFRTVHAMTSLVLRLRQSQAG